MMGPAGPQKGPFVQKPFEGCRVSFGQLEFHRVYFTVYRFKGTLAN